MTDPTTPDPAPIDVRRLDHVAIAVSSDEEFGRAVTLLEDLLGGQFVCGGDDHRRGMRSIQFQFPGSFKVEILVPLREDCKLGRSVARRGPGFHHMTILVDDVGACVGQLHEAGYEVTDSDFDNAVWKETYIRPKDAFGALVQIAQTSRDPVCRYPFTSGDVQAGKVVWNEDEEPVWAPGPTPPLGRSEHECEHVRR